MKTELMLIGVDLAEIVLDALNNVLDLPPGYKVCAVSVNDLGKGSGSDCAIVRARKTEDK